MDSKEITTVLKRYINNKFTNTNLMLKTIDSKLNSIINFMDKTKNVVDNNEKKIKTLNTYLYKAMRNLHTLIENSSGIVGTTGQVECQNENISLKDFEEFDFNKISKKKEKKIIMNNVSVGNMRELKKENLEVDSDIVIKHLKVKDLNSDINFFKYLYMENGKECCPIRYLTKNNYQYWFDGAWCDDNCADEIIDILVKNITKLYMKNNTYDNFGIDIDKYQTYIYSMSEKKYKDSFIKKLKDLVKI